MADRIKNLWENIGDNKLYVKVATICGAEGIIEVETRPSPNI